MVEEDLSVHRIGWKHEDRPFRCTKSTIWKIPSNFEHCRHVVIDSWIAGLHGAAVTQRTPRKAVSPFINSDKNNLVSKDVEPYNDGVSALHSRRHALLAERVGQRKLQKTGHARTSRRFVYIIDCFHQQGVLQEGADKDTLAIDMTNHTVQRSQPEFCR